MHYIVEMQVATELDYAIRCQYYSAIVLSEQLQKKEKYRSLNPVIFIGVLDFNLFKTTDFISHHFILDTKTHDHELTHLEFHFIELKKFNKELNELTSDLEKWIYFLKNAPSLDHIPSSLNESVAIHDAFDVLKKGNWSKKELSSYNKHMLSLWSYESQFESGKEIGREEGREEDEEKGAKKKAIAIAKELLQHKMSIESVAKITGLSISEIESFSL